MAWTSGFFNSVSGDRTYNAEQLNSIFEGLITDGVYNSVGNQLAVQPNSGMTIQIATGRGYFGTHWVNNDAEYLLTVEDSDVTLNRYCAVCIRVDDTDSGRKAEPYLKYGAIASSPVKPTMERTDTIKEYCLAYIYIGAGVSEIKASAIEDARSNTAVCGWVTGLIKQIDTSTLYAQFEAQFIEWFESLKEYLDDDVETKLVGDVYALQNRCIKATGTFDGLGWISQADGTYTQTIAVQGVTANNDILITASAAYAETYAAMKCKAIAQSSNAITFSCINPVDEAVTVDVIIFNFS